MASLTPTLQPHFHPNYSHRQSNIWAFHLILINSPMIYPAQNLDFEKCGQCMISSPTIVCERQVLRSIFLQHQLGNGQCCPICAAKNTILPVCYVYSRPLPSSVTPGFYPRFYFQITYSALTCIKFSTYMTILIRTWSLLDYVCIIIWVNHC